MKPWRRPDLSLLLILVLVQIALCQRHHAPRNQRGRQRSYHSSAQQASQFDSTDRGRSRGDSKATSVSRFRERDFLRENSSGEHASRSRKRSNGGGAGSRSRQSRKNRPHTSLKSAAASRYSRRYNPYHQNAHKRENGVDADQGMMVHDLLCVIQWYA